MQDNYDLLGRENVLVAAQEIEMPPESIDIIFDKNNFLPVYSNDILNASREILIVSPYATKRRTLQMLQHLKTALCNQVKVMVVTRPVDDFNDKDITVL